MKKALSIFILTIVVFSILSCNQETKDKLAKEDKKAQESIKKWIENRADEYPYYTPLEFGELTPRYRFNSRTHSIATAIEKENNAEQPDIKKLDSLKNMLKTNKEDFLGYTITHRFTTKGIDGQITTHEKLFFIDGEYRVITVLNVDAWDLIMDKELFFKPESPDSVQ
ncbi:hypothetical protein [Tenuifilum thalassicum]|uniref:Uncharacterized protein n=1 Tax=Tenuifilum thalassicum TaxID=2590900 RepID=A0A7D4BSS6_9BACT|nr:hypothetical protein [Tenuifilum thalassicum]QKG80681.1 hypothetical protein FHG85_10520 [Tenuifilum thalassicum]